MLAILADSLAQSLSSSWIMHSESIQTNRISSALSIWIASWKVLDNSSHCIPILLFLRVCFVVRIIYWIHLFSFDLVRKARCGTASHTWVSPQQWLRVAYWAISSAKSEDSTSAMIWGIPVSISISRVGGRTWAPFSGSQSPWHSMQVLIHFAISDEQSCTRVSGSTFCAMPNLLHLPSGKSMWVLATFSV